MRLQDVYPILCNELRKWQSNSYSQLREMIDSESFTTVFEMAGEPIAIEVSVEWADHYKKDLRIIAQAFGPSSFRLERMCESVLIKAD